MKNKFKVSVVGGAGHIGLPLSLFISSFGHDVTIIDTNQKVLEGLKGGNLPFYEDGLDKYLKKAQKNNIKLSNNNQDLSKSDFVIITLGSSSEAKDIDLFKKVMDDVIKNIKQESNIILRSTIDIDSIEEIRSNPEFIEKNINLAYCPERIAEGMSLIELPQIPQIIGISDENDFLIFQNFFNTLNIESIKTT